MPPSSIKHRHLGRSSAHRQALLRNLVTSLIDHESIATTWPKAKEAQRVAEKLITLGKRNTQAARNKAQSYLFNPHLYIDKVFGSLRERYALRPGGYTRVLRIEPKKDDQAPSAILELVDGPKDIRFAMTAKTLLRMREEEKGMNEWTSVNVHKVTRYRKHGEEDLENEVKRLERLKLRDEKLATTKAEKKAAKEEEDEAAAEEEANWVDEEVVERMEVPPSALRTRKNIQHLTRKTESREVAVVQQQQTQKEEKQPYLRRHERRKAARDAQEAKVIKSA